MLKYGFQIVFVQKGALSLNLKALASHMTPAWFIIKTIVELFKGLKQGAMGFFIPYSLFAQIMFVNLEMYFMITGIL